MDCQGKFANRLAKVAGNSEVNMKDNVENANKNRAKKSWASFLDASGPRIQQRLEYIPP